MHAVDSPVFDADNHYYEALDAFTRHLDPAHGPRVIEWVEAGGRRYHALGGRISRAVTNPTFNPVAPAGASAALTAQLAGFRRQALHAARLGLKHPLSGRELNFEAPLPADFAALLAALEA